MLINNKSLINTINKLNLTDDEREKFNKISEDDRGNFLYNGKPIINGATAEQAAQIEANRTAIGNENSGLTKEINDINNALTRVDAVTLNGKKISNPMTKEEYDSIVNKDENTIYLVDDNNVVTRVPDYSTTDANKLLAVNSTGTALAWVDAPSGSGTGITAEQIAQIEANKTAIGTEELSTTAKTLKGAINEVFQDVDNGKTLIASAITDKGITTSNNDTFQTMADNISRINSVITDVNINSYNILKNNWKFKLLSNNGTDISYTNEISQNYDDSTFENISVPHDWAIYKEFNSSSPGSYEGGYLDGGDGVYRIKLDTASLNGQKVFLYFDGIFMESEVYINGNLIGLNKWYNPFYFDITNSLNFDGNDTLAVLVRVKQPCSRWYSGAGIFRNVYLVTGNYIDVAINSIHVTIPNLETELTKGYATTNVKMSINNKNEESKNINIKNEIYFNNELVAYNNEVKQLSNGNNEYTCNILVPNPKLWHEYQGNIYTLKTIIQIDGAEVYINYTKYGYRYFKFDKDTGFWLNGINMKLRGVCLHHDLGCLGAEVNKSAIERQIRILKNMGCNAIRITHNPASTEFLEVCAKEGMLLIEELFDCWTASKKTNDFARFFNEYSERVIKFTVNRGKNNPAIIMYGVGNEIIRTMGGKYTAETATALVSNMINTIKAIDTERMVTMAEDLPDNSIARAVMQLMDVVGVNYGNDREYASLREAYPEFKVYGSETTSALSSRGIYARDNVNLQCSSKDNDFVDWGDSAAVALKRHMDSDYLAGMFIWTGFDYIGEPTPFNKYPARSSYFGIIDLAGFPKDIYYMYQSRWTKKPMIHVFPHWNWENGNTVNVWLYSNCDKVELFVNGISKGVKTKDNIGSKYNYEYNVSYEAGTLLAKGMDSEGNVLVQEEIKTSSTPYKISLTSDKSLIKQGGDDLIFVECNVLDENDIVCRTANNLINFSVTGGTIIGTDNGDATDVSTSLRHPNRKLFNGKALCVVKPDNTDADVIITATSDGLQETSINVKKSQITAYANSIVKIPGDIEAPLHPILNYATGISFNNNAIQLKQTRQYQLEITLLGGYVYDSISYSANNENVSVTNSGLVTGNTLGESIVTVTMIANGITYEDTCTITVIENTIGVLYNLESPTVFDGTNFIDTGVCARDTDKNLTIFISYNGKAGDPGENQVCVMHAMLESTGYPGVAIDTVDRNYRIAAYGNNYYLLDDNDNKINYTECSSEQKICIRITSGSNTINVKYKIEGRTASVKTKDMTMGTNTFNNTILLGAYRDVSDVKGRYWKGTINSFTVYDKVLTDEEVNALFESEPPLPPTPPTTNYATGISFKKDAVTLKQTNQYQLEITLSGGDVYDSITYSANNENVSVTNSGLVTGNTLGNSIVTVTMIANEITYEDTCTITVIENTSTEPEPVEPAEGVLYNLESPTVFNGSNFIDTGVCARDTDKDLTIFISYNGEADANADRMVQYCVMHAMLESTGYPGISIDTSYNEYRVGTAIGNYWIKDDAGNRIKCTDCSSEQKICIRITSGSNAIKINYKVEGKNASIKTMNGFMGTATFNNTILLGAYRDSSDVKGRYWKGTINSFTVYDRVLTDEEVNALFGVEPPLPPTPPADDYTALDISNIQKGQPFTLYDGALDLNEQTVFADITLDDSSVNENVLSIGKDINKWQGGDSTRLHCYYPTALDSTKQLKMELSNTPTQIREIITLAGNAFKIALNANGVYVNGTKINSISESEKFSVLVAQKTAQIGSLEGNTRSKATYNEVGIYNRLLSSEELVTLTSIDA